LLSCCTGGYPIRPTGRAACVRSPAAREFRVTPPRASIRLVQLFERELRQFDAGDGVSKPTVKVSKPRVSGELDQQVVEFADEIRTSGSTPEQMLVELKSLLSNAAPEVSTSQRAALVATVTGRAIMAFFKK
jgi:hypothetical protein